MTSATTMASTIEMALRSVLPASFHHTLPSFASILAEVVSGRVPAEQAGAHLASEPDFNEVFQSLTGRTIDSERVRLHFSGDTITVGNIRDSDALAIGRGAIAIKIVQTEEQAYKVIGLPNPYLGLEAFTYESRGKFAGRKREVAAAIELLTAPGAQQALLFITGASGSGKSSFAQAGVVPALEAYYLKQQCDVQHTAFRPSRNPIDALKESLLRLKLTGGNLAISAVLERPERFMRFLEHVTPPQQINLIVLDQFEELFSQSEANQRAALFQMLAHVPPFSKIRTHIIATMRSDYLPELFDHKEIYEIAKNGLDLRAMEVAELKDAIQRPVQQEPAASAKHFEPALLDKLAFDAAGDAANLPLLQITLTDLWNKGWLRLSAYSNLSAAMSESAEKIYRSTYRNHREQSRSVEDQAAMMAIFLDLVKVGLDDDPRHDVRRRRSFQELVADHPDRVPLVEELVAARLLSRSFETRGDAPVDVVDIIHETLIANWARLRQAMIDQRETLQRRVRFELALDEWQRHAQADDYVLEGIRLAEAESLAEQNDIALRAEPARTLLQRSLDRREAEHKREIRQAQALAEEQRLRAEDQQRANKRLRVRLLAAAIFAVVAVITASLALYSFNEATNEAKRAEEQRQIAESEARRAEAEASRAEAQTGIARSRQLAAQALNQIDEHPDLALLLSVEAQRITDTLESKQSLFESLVRRPYLNTMLHGHVDTVNGLAFTPDGQVLISSGLDARVIFWDVAARKPLVAPVTDVTRPVIDLAVSPDGKMLVTADTDRQVVLWDLTTYEPMYPALLGHTWGVQAVAFSPDSTIVASGSCEWIDTCERGEIRLWNALTGQQVNAPLYGHTESVQSLAFSPDGMFLVSGSSDGSIILWSAQTFQPIGDPLQTHSGFVLDLAFSPDGKILASAGSFGGVTLWDMTVNPPNPTTLLESDHSVSAIAFFPNNRILVSAGADGSLVLWDLVRKQQLLKLLDESNSSLSAVALSSDGAMLVSGGGSERVQGGNSSDTSMMLWDFRKADVLGRFLFLEDHAGTITSAALSPDGAILATGGDVDDQMIILWDTQTGEPIGSPLRGHTSAVTSLVFSPDGSMLASGGGGSDGTVIMWDMATRQLLGSPLVATTTDSVISGLAFSPDGRILAAGGCHRKKDLLCSQGEVRMWDVASRQPLDTLLIGHEDAVSAIVFSPESDMLISASDGPDATIIVWDVTNRAMLGPPLQADWPGVSSLALNATGSMLASGSSIKEEITLWDVATYQRVGRLLGGPATALAFSPDSANIASGDYNGQVVLWDVRSGQPVGRLAQNPDALAVRNRIEGLIFNKDGTLLVSVGAEKIAAFWDLDRADWINYACYIANRNLTPEEWAQYIGGSYRPSCEELPE